MPETTQPPEARLEAIKEEITKLKKQLAGAKKILTDLGWNDGDGLSEELGESIFDLDKDLIKNELGLTPLSGVDLLKNSATEGFSSLEDGLAKLRAERNALMGPQDRVELAVSEMLQQMEEMSPDEKIDFLTTKIAQVMVANESVANKPTATETVSEKEEDEEEDEDFDEDYDDDYEDDEDEESLSKAEMVMLKKQAAELAKKPAAVRKHVFQDLERQLQETIKMRAEEIVNLWEYSVDAFKDIVSEEDQVAILAVLSAAHKLGLSNKPKEELMKGFNKDDIDELADDLLDIVRVKNVGWMRKGLNDYKELFKLFLLRNKDEIAKSSLLAKDDESPVEKVAVPKAGGGEAGSATTETLAPKNEILEENKSKIQKAIDALGDLTKLEADNRHGDLINPAIQTFSEVDKKLITADTVVLQKHIQAIIVEAANNTTNNKKQAQDILTKIGLGI